MRRPSILIPSVLCLGLISLWARPAFAQSSHDNFLPPPPRVILTFGSMVPVSEALTGTANPVRGLPGDSAVWNIAKSAKGSLTSAGHLVITVRGLASDTGADQLTEGSDPNSPQSESDLHGMVTCLGVAGTSARNGTGTPTGVGSGSEAGSTIDGVMTQGFPMSPSGSVDIVADLALPDPCVAPAVFLVSGTSNGWIAVNGFDSVDFRSKPSHVGINPFP
jgi:hypothetical protein